MISANTPLIWQITNRDELASRLQCVQEKEHPELHRLLNQLMVRDIRSRPPVTQPQVQAVKSLGTRFPNFSDFIEWIVQSLQLSASCQMPIIIRPHLLVGPPGLGKSFIVRHLADALDLSYDRLSVPDITANFVLSGNSSSWAGGKPGFIAESLAAGPVPWLVFDELDKCGHDDRFPVQPTLLSMLETSTANEFRDECLGVKLDIRPLIFTFTANRTDTIEQALRSRLQIIEVRAPRSEDMPALVMSVDEVLRQEDPRIGMIFAPLSASCSQVFESMPPREVQHVLARAYFSALQRHRGRRIRLKEDEIRAVIRQVRKASPRRKAIGFHASHP